MKLSKAARDWARDYYYPSEHELVGDGLLLASVLGGAYVRTDGEVEVFIERSQLRLRVGNVYEEVLFHLDADGNVDDVCIVSRGEDGP